MERARHRNSKSATGIQQIQKQKAVSRFYSDSHSCTGGITRDDMSSSRKNTGTPMKKLPTEKMPKEVETKRLSPSVIARLMGLNGLPPPRRADKQQTRLSDSYQQKNVSMSIRKNGQLNNGRSIRRSSTEHREFEDVYEDMTTSRFVNRRYSSRWSASPRLMKPEIAPIQQKFLDAKRLSTVEKLQGSKEFDDTLEMLDSNKDLLLKFLEQPDSLFVKHLHDMQVDPSSSLRSHLPDLEPSNSARYESNIKPWKSERDVSCKYDINSLHKHEDGLFLHLYSHCRAHISRKSSKIHLEERNGKNILPTRIVVLKPNLRKMHSAGTSALSTDYAHDYLSNCRRVKERPSFGGDETLSRKRKISSNDGRFSKPMSREAREIAREITRRMRDGCDGVIDQMFPRVRGYGGDESSYDANGSDSTTESEVFKLPSRNSFCMNNRHKYSCSGLIESSVSRDRKKRLSERREATWRCQDAEGIGKGSKLGKMLGMPDREIRPKHLNAMLGLDGASDRAASMNGSPLWDGPLGISSSVRTLSRSRSLPSSSFSRRNHIRNAQCEVLSEDPYLMLSGTSRGTSKFVKANTSWNEYLSMKASARGKKVLPCYNTFICETDYSPETNSKIEMEKNLEVDSSEYQPMVSQICKSRVPDAVIDTAHGALSLKSTELLPLLSCSKVENDSSSACNQEDSSIQEPCKGPSERGSACLQCPVAEPCSSETTREADDASPVSVLEAPFTEDSSSESFERVSTELHELQKHLQLLKMESEAYAQVPALFSNQEEVAQQSQLDSEENQILRAESWEVSYFLDVLIASGFEVADPDMLGESWYTPECPLHPAVFDNLEKKYSEETTVSRSERRLLFDRINSSLLEFLQQHVDSFTLVLPKIIGVSSKWETHRVEDAIRKLLTGQELLVNMDLSDRTLYREMQWLEFKDEIDVIGNEIEKLLIDDMILDVLPI